MKKVKISKCDTCKHNKRQLYELPCSKCKHIKRGDYYCPKNMKD